MYIYMLSKMRDIYVYLENRDIPDLLFITEVLWSNFSEETHYFFEERLSWTGFAIGY